MWGKTLAWFKKAWAWLKRNWKWVLLPIGILIALAAIFRRKQPATVVVVDKTPTAAVDVAIHDNQTAAQVEAATQATADEIKKIEEEHKAALEKLNSSQRLEYETLKQKPAQEITNWLIKVGKGEQ